MSAIVSPEDQKVTFVELFFDLVFVFSVTQVVALFHHHLEWATVGQAILVFWLVWWAWTQFTWALNAADTTNPRIELGVLFATGVAFFMAIALPGAFGELAFRFAIPYVVVRTIGLAIYSLVTAQNPQQAASVRQFGLLSLGGLAAVLIGAFVGGSAQYIFWGLAIILDIVAAAIGGQADGWNIHPEHFSERHGLFVIIALGETLIVAAGSVTGADWTTMLLAVAVLAVAITCGWWWSYFSRTKPMLDQALERCVDSVRTKLARDVFSLLHFPMMLGVIAYAVAIEEVAIHPDEPMSFAARLALAAGLALFVGGMAAAVWRATRRVLVVRIAVVIVAAIAIVALGTVTPPITMTIALLAVVLIAVVEERMLKPIGETPVEMS